jgi:hypothetical protein
MSKKRPAPKSDLPALKRRERAPLDAGNSLRSYLRSGHPLFVWRAYATYRAAGLLVPENILEKLDQWASRLELAESKEAILDALEVRLPAGQARTASLARAQLDKERIVATTMQAIERRDALKELRARGEDLDDATIAESIETDDQIFRRMATRFGQRDGADPLTTPGTLKGWYHAQKNFEREGATLSLTDVWHPKRK